MQAITAMYFTDHLRESINPVYTKSVIDRIREMDLSDNRYLYSYGEYVGEKELETAKNISEIFPRRLFGK